jgi:hypothetical protein
MISKNNKEEEVGERVHLHVVIKKGLYETIKRIAVEKYGKYRGGLSYVVAEALELYLGMHTQIHTNPRRSIRDVYEQVVLKIKEIMHTPLKPLEAPEAVLDRAIAEVRGSDQRTVEKWKNIFEKSGLIKFIGGAKPNRVVELL